MAKSKTIVMRVDEERANRYAEIAKTRGVSTSEWMRTVLDRALETSGDTRLLDQRVMVDEYFKLDKRAEAEGMSPGEIAFAQIDLILRQWAVSMTSGRASAGNGV